MTDYLTLSCDALWSLVVEGIQDDLRLYLALSELALKYSQSSTSAILPSDVCATLLRLLGESNRRPEVGLLACSLLEHAYKVKLRIL